MSNAYTGSSTDQAFDTAAIQSIYGPAKKRLGDNSYALGETS